MKLYHVSPIENEESILEAGLFPANTSMATCVAGAGGTLQNTNITGVYGFISLDDAIEFCELNQGVEANVIVAFDVPEGCKTMNDPEYDGQAIFVVTDEPIAVTKVEAE